MERRSNVLYSLKSVSSSITTSPHCYCYVLSGCSFSLRLMWEMLEKTQCIFVAWSHSGHLPLALTMFCCYFSDAWKSSSYNFISLKNCVIVSHLCQLWRLDLFDLEEVSDGQEGDGHCTDADHKDDQWWTVVNVAPQVLYRIQQVHLHMDKYTVYRHVSNSIFHHRGFYQ